MRRAVAYCRFSSDKQRDSYSIAAQVDIITDYCNKEGYTLVGKYVDEARTGTNDDRESFQKMISDSALGKFDFVIVHKLDRFSRDRYNSIIYRKILKDNGVKLISVAEKISDDPSGVILESVIEGVNEYYSANLRTETRKGLYQRAKLGKACGNIPLGFSTDSEGFFIPIEEEAAIVREIFSRVASDENASTIIKDLTNRNVRGKRGKKLTYHSLEKIIHNTLYYGTYTYAWGGGEPVIVPNCVDPIVDKTLWDLANQMLATHSRPAYSRHKEEDYVLTGFLYCGECGHHYRGHKVTLHKKKGDYIYRRYRCSESAHGTCRAPVIDKELLERSVFTAIERDILRPEIMSEVATSVNRVLKRRIAESDSGKAKSEIADIEAKKEKLLDIYLDGTIDKKTYQARLGKMDLRINELTNQIALDGGIIASRIDTDMLIAAFKYFFTKADMMSPKDQLMILNNFVDRITIYNDRIVITYKIKDPTGGVYKSEFGKPSKVLSNTNSGGVKTLLDITYRIKSYSLKHVDVLLSSSDIEDYKIRIV